VSPFLIKGRRQELMKMLLYFLKKRTYFHIIIMRTALNYQSCKIFYICIEWFYFRKFFLNPLHLLVYLVFYTGCPRRNVPDFGRVFLMLKYTDITQNTYSQSWTVMEIMAREKCGLLAVPRTAPFQLTRYWYTAHVLETGMQSTSCLRAHVKCLEP